MEKQSTADGAGRSHWTGNFPRYWALIGSPLRPCAEDLAVVEKLLAESDFSFVSSSPRRVLLLGVTPEIATARWPTEVDLVAVDISPAMIDAIWPGNGDNRHAVCGDWCKAPFASGSFDLLIGDGCLTAVSFPDGLGGTIAEAHRCLQPDGLLLLRLFCRPAVGESIDSVFAALQAGSIGSFHAFKWRLAMAIQGAAQAPDVAVAEIWRVWDAAQIDRQALVTRLGWTLDGIAMIDLYRDSDARYNFMTFDATLEHLRRGGFDAVATRYGSYELAERCPHVLLRRRQLAPPGSIGADAR